MVELGSGQAREVVPHAAFHGFGFIEKEVHGLLRAHRLRGEWFELSLASILQVVAVCISARELAV
jgi:hypothetical protein